MEMLDIRMEGCHGQCKVAEGKAQDVASKVDRSQSSQGLVDHGQGLWHYSTSPEKTLESLEHKSDKIKFTLIYIM